MLTLDNLKRRGRALANKRFFCGEGEETIDCCERDSSFLERFFCGKMSQKDLDDSPP